MYGLAKGRLRTSDCNGLDWGIRCWCTQVGKKEDPREDREQLTWGGREEAGLVACGYQ